MASTARYECTSGFYRLDWRPVWNRSCDPADRRKGGTDIPGAIFSVSALGLILYTFTVGAEDDWLATRTIVLAIGEIVALIAFIWRERTASDPMLNLNMFRNGTVRGSVLLQSAVMTAMVAVMFVSTQLFQYAWGWTPWQAGLAQLPFVIGMLGAGPIVDRMVASQGHRRTSAVGIVFVLASLLVWIAALYEGVFWALLGMLLMTIGMRTIMTTAAVTLLGELPEDQTSIGSALNDTVQELGNSVDVAIVGTITAVALSSGLLQEAWSQEIIDKFLDAQMISFGVIFIIVAVVAFVGVRTLSNSTTTED